MSKDIFVIQVIPTGPDGYPKDGVAEVGIASVDLDSGEIRSVYQNRIRHEPGSLDESKIEYLENNSGMKASDLADADPADSVVKEVKDILKGGTVTSFDVANVFYRYMIPEPWDITFEVSIMPSVSSRMPYSLRCRKPFEENKAIMKAYSAIYGEEAPLNASGSATALDLALMTAYIIISLRRQSKY
ncbi:MAG: hypothetical protein PHI62_02215 [Candidatus Methanomethylophilaceae archaeon]|nr:hypothetical protein [Candidatus Methanomethylophilaceae archaeon]